MTRRRRAASAESVDVVTIESIAAGGDGVGRLDGRALFVPRTAPGDVVQVAWRAQGRFGRGRVLQLLTPSPQRQEPRCHHYVADRCGGCQLQHLTDQAQRDARRQIVRDSVQRLGRREIPLPVLTSHASWAYRRRLTLALHRTGAGWVGGLHPHDDASRVFPLQECPIADPFLVETWRAIQAVIRGRTPALPSAALLRVSLRETSGTADASRVSVVISGGMMWPDAAAWAEAVIRQATVLAVPLASIWWVPQGGVAVRIDAGAEDAEEAAFVAEASSGDAPSDEATPEPQDALAFAQVNATVAEALRALVHQQVLQLAPAHVVDAYAGTGAFAVRLAEAGVAVTAIEADPAGAASAERRLADRPGARVVCEAVERALPTAATAATGVIILNPPRRGVDALVTGWLESAAAAAVQALVYVSCDPATLARDVARMPSWRIAHVECFDMFPQTAHVETVCVLRREVA